MYRLKKENIAKGGELMARNDELLRSVDALSVKIGRSNKCWSIKSVRLIIGIGIMR